jgi:magnesium-protoporphyrin IX monomethyl ester (oxidative) cyclase
MAPLGLLSIAAYLEKRGHSVEVEDCLGPYAAGSPDETVRRILKQNPGYIGFSTTTSAFLDAYDLAGRIKSIRPDITTIFGGVHVSAMGGELLNQFPYIDALCLGEGEETLAQLAEGTNPPDIHGLAFRDNESVVVNQPRELIPDLDSLPFPAYEKLPGFPSKYNLPLFSYVKPPGATMITSRGCPYQCSYCDRSVFKRGYRYNSPSYIYEHMKYLRNRFGVRHINIYDDLFTLHRERIESLCDMLIQKPLGVQFNCAVRVGHTDDALLGILKAAGGLMVSIGIESGEPALLEVHKPGVYLDEVRNTVAHVHAAGLRAKGLFMMGLPGETPESIKKTSDFVMSLELDDMNMTKFTPFRGAPVWRNIFAEGQVEEDWRKMNCLNFVFLPRGIESWEMLDQLYNNHVKRFYSDPKWRKRFRGRLWEHRYSLLRLLRHLPDFLSAMRSFEPRKG